MHTYMNAAPGSLADLDERYGRARAVEQQRWHQEQVERVSTLKVRTPHITAALRTCRCCKGKARATARNHFADFSLISRVAARGRGRVTTHAVSSQQSAVSIHGNGTTFADPVRSHQPCLQHTRSVRWFHTFQDTICLCRSPLMESRYFAA
jgi:hypothetical protein